MKRRSVLAGLGTTALGLGALGGSGAFTSASIQRGASIDVVADENGLLGITAELDGDTITDTGDGELGWEWTIDTDTSSFEEPPT